MRRFAVVVLAGLMTAPLAGVAGPLTQDACSGAASGPVVWKQLGNDVLENLLFAEGRLWISDGTAGAIRAFEPDGTEVQGVTGIPSPGGLVHRSVDGLVYAGWGNALVGAALQTGEAKVVRFDPADPGAGVTDVATGLHMPNGMIEGPAGELYTSNDVGYGLMRVDPETGTVSELARVWGTNGLVVLGDDLYAAVTFDQRSPIARVSLSDPSDLDHDIQLSFGVASLEPALHADNDPTAPLLGVKGLDDMTSDAAGTLYVVANGTGELLKVDPSTGDACLIAGGLQNPSSVRIAPPAFDADGKGTLDLFITEFSGAIKVVRHAA